jgi:hypothetical protein
MKQNDFAGSASILSLYVMTKKSLAKAIGGNH